MRNKPAPRGNGIELQDQTRKSTPTTYPADSATESPGSAEAPCDADGVIRRSSTRWWIGVAAGLLVALPLGWLLCIAALLPFFIGLFFFALFGLLLGAVVHRVASPGRPYARAPVIIGTVLLVAGCWAISAVTEGHRVPISMARKATMKTRDLGTYTPAEHTARVTDQIRAYLRRHYPPGGTIGYLRWMLAGGEIAKGKLEGVHRTLRENQRGFWFAFRVVCSITLLAFGIGSQTFLMRLPRDPAVIKTDHDG